MLFTSIVFEALFSTVSAHEFNRTCCGSKDKLCGFIGGRSFPLPILATTPDMLISGHFTMEYMRMLKKCTNKEPMKYFASIVLCEEECKAKLMRLEEYVCIMTQTIKKFVPCDLVCDFHRTNKVIACIYEAAKKHCASNGQLLIFSAIALHNMNLLVNFTRPDYCSKALDGVSRGLLQIQTQEYYAWLSRNGKSANRDKYLSCPAILDEFTCDTIMDEFGLFLKYFDTFKTCCTECSGSNSIGSRSMKDTLENMNTLDYAISNRLGLNSPELDKMLQRRLRIFCYMKTLFAKQIGPFAI